MKIQRMTMTNTLGILTAIAAMAPVERPPKSVFAVSVGEDCEDIGGCEDIGCCEDVGVGPYIHVSVRDKPDVGPALAHHSTTAVSVLSHMIGIPIAPALFKSYGNIVCDTICPSVENEVRSKRFVTVCPTRS
jgi:hypothetical protein